MSIKRFFRERIADRWGRQRFQPEAKIALDLPCAGRVNGEPRRKVLVVDDDPVISKALSFKLSSWGYAPVMAADGSEAIAAMREERPGLVLMDVNFPPDVANGGVAWDGFSLAGWLRTMGGGGRLAVIFMTASDPAHYQEQVSANQGVGIFQKSKDLYVLLELIKVACTQA